MGKTNKLALGATSVVLSGVLLTGSALPAFNYNNVLAVETTANAVAFNKAELKEGQRVTVQGKVTSVVNAWGGMGFFLETNDGQGIYVYPKQDLAIKKGNEITFTAKVAKYNGAWQLVEVDGYKLVTFTSEFQPKSATVADLTEKLQGNFVSLENLTVSDLQEVDAKYQSSRFVATDANGNKVNVFIDNRTGAKYPEVAAKIGNGDKINIQAFLSTNNKGEAELKVDSINAITVTNSTPKVAKEVANIGEIQGESHLSPLQGKKVKFSNVVVTKKDKKGFYVQDLAPDNNEKTSDAVYVVSKEKVEKGDKLSIEGIVTEGYGDGYADKDRTDLSTTQITNATITKEGTAALPEAIDISKKMPKDNVDNDGLTEFEPNEDAIDYWESLEGMLVKVTKPRVLGPQYHSEIYVLPSDYKGKPLNNAQGLSLNADYKVNTEIIPILLDQRTYRAKAKDYFESDISGVVTYTYGGYKVFTPVSELPKKKDGNLQREKSTILPHEDKLTIASYNIENFSANPDKKETPEEKVEKIAKSFINEIYNPDIISLIEVQDNNGGIDDGTVDGRQSGERLAKKIKELGGKEYKYTEVAPVNNVDGGKPGANIRVAFLYNPERVKLIGEAAASNEAAKFENGHLVKNPARITPESPAFSSVRKSLAAEFEFKGEHVVVIANHLKSKRGDNSVWGKTQPAVEVSQPARVEQAKIINEFVKSGLAQNPDLKFVLTGDFNDYEFSNTLKAIEGNELVNLMKNHTKEDRYSYFYRGNNQSLDNIVVSKNILDRTVFDAVHVNSSFMEEDGRASDHDPLVAQIDFSKKASDEGQKPGNNQQNPNFNYEGSGSEWREENLGSYQNGGKVEQEQKDNDKKEVKEKSTKRQLSKTGLVATSSLGVVSLLLLAAYALRRKLNK